MATQTVGLEELRENLSSFIEGGEAFAITRHGQTLGFFVPAQRPADREAALERLDSVSKEVDELIASWGASEEELMAEISEIRRKERAQRSSSY